MVKIIESQEIKSLSLQEMFSRLESSSKGLSAAEAEKRLGQFGPNVLAEKETSPLLKFLSYFWGPIPAMIMIAAGLSAALHHWTDLYVILTLLVLNGVVGFREEYEAGNAVAALKANLALQAKVKRENKWQERAAQDLVPGDVIRVRIGDIVPADVRLLEGDPVQIDQSALTGESLPVEKNAGDTAYSGSIIRQGEIDALVYGTGVNTFYGKTAELVQSTETQSHLQQAIIKIANYLIVIAVALAIMIFFDALYKGDKLLDILRFALVLTIAAVPVAMPSVLSVTMALGSRALAKKNAIVTRLSSIEEVAGIDVLCSDKTGTLTQNKLALGDPFVLGATKIEEVILWGALASRQEDQDPIDYAVIEGLQDAAVLTKYTVGHFMPFDPVHKRTEAEITDADGANFKVTKGAAQVILALDPNIEGIRPEVEKAVNAFASRGFRSIGVARTDEKGQWSFAGVLPLLDPLRMDAKTTVDTAREMGIQVKMATGDQMAIAREISSQLGIGKNIVDAELFAETRQHEAGQLADAIENANGFAQVFPEHKYHIVDVLQQRGHIVGMTGDGVNDAPALKKADAGIAVSGATDAARAAADIVLLTPGLSVIIDAVKESRRIFQRMLNYAIYRIAETVALLAFLTSAIIFFDLRPVTAIMIVLLAILNDGAILSIAYDKVHYSKKPQ